jgi:hypothetical protein
MNSEISTEKIRLKALIVYCCPESGHFLPLDCSDLPPFFAAPDLAVSASAQNRGWCRKLAQAFRVYTGNDEQNLILRLNSYDIILVYPLSLNTLAKFALGIQDSFPTRILAEAAALGKPILLNDQFLPSVDGQMNPHLIRIYRQHWERLLSGTISSFNFDNLDQVAVKILRNRSNQAAIQQGINRPCITREDVIIAAESLEPMKVPAGAIITDLAREEAQARGVIILQS